MIHSIKLLCERKFLPLFITQVLGALNDNILRGSIIIFISFKLADNPGYASFWTNIATALFMLPTLLFSITSGELADKYRKVYLLRGTKFAEILIAILTCYLFITNQTSPSLLMICVFLMGLHAAAFSPAKFSYIPEYLEDEEILPANGLIESSTFAAIALGSGLSALITGPNHGITIFISLLLPIAIIGWLSSLLIPTNLAQNPDLSIQKNIFTATQKQIDRCSNNPQIWLPIIGISWFWVTGMIHMVNLPAYVQFELGYNSYVSGFLNGIFTIGIAIGALTTTAVLRGKLNTRYVPISLFIASAFSLHLYYGSYSTFTYPNIGTLSQFLSQTHSYRIIMDMLIISVALGLYVVPLYAILQQRSPLKACARIMATTNVVNSLFMISVTILSTFLLSALKMPVSKLFFMTSIFNVGLSMYLLKILPFSSVKPTLARFFRWFFKVEVQGLEHFLDSSNRLVIIANHVSFLDVLFLALFLPQEYAFAVDTEISKKWYLRIAKHFVETHAVDPTNPIRMKRIVKVIAEGKPCVIFPEGRLSNTGSLMKVFDGAAMLADLADADVMTVHIRGLKYSIFSRLQGIYKLRLRTQVKITILPVFRLNANQV